MILRAYRTELDPTTEQRKEMARAAGTARFVYNWGLTRWREQYAQWLAWSKSDKTAAEPVKPSWMALHKELTQVKKQPDTAWISETSAYVVREAMADLGAAYKNFFRRLREGLRGKEAGEPQYRSRNDRSGRGFRVAQPQAVDVAARAVKIAGIGWVKLREYGYIPVGANYRGVSVREMAGRWYVAVQVEEKDRAAPVQIETRTGVEIGVRVLAVTTAGQSATAIRDLVNIPREKRRLALWSRRQARKHKQGVPSREQSKAYKMCVMRVRAAHVRIASIRKDALHQTTTRIVRRARTGALVLRDMQVKRMIGRAGKSGAEARKRSRLAPMVSQVGLFELRRQVEYKQQWAGGVTVIAPTDYPSTRRCSACGSVRATDPGYPTFVCGACDLRIDREENSAINLRDFVPQNTVDGNDGRTGRRKTAKAAQRSAEPERSAAQNTASTSPDDSSTVLGAENGARGAKASRETEVTEYCRDPTQRAVSAQRVSTSATVSSDEVLHRQRRDRSSVFEPDSMVNTGPLANGRVSG